MSTAVPAEGTDPLVGFYAMRRVYMLEQYGHVLGYFVDPTSYSDPYIFNKDEVYLMRRGNGGKGR
jgi:hypothetical protein